MATPNRKHSEHSNSSELPGRYLSRREAADLLGVAESTMMQYEQRGKITSHWAVVPDVAGRLRNAPIYKIDDVLKLPRKAPVSASENPDELTARAFEMFEAGKSVREAIILLRATKEKIDKLHEDWIDTGGAALIIPESSRKALEAKFGPIASAEDLVAKACR
jgi:hypothetical protein